MHIQVVGAGSVGLLLSSFLVQNGHNVNIVCRSNEQAKSLMNNRLTRINTDGTSERFEIQASTNMNEQAEVTFVTVKSGQIRDVLPLLNQQIPTFFCQNGLSHYYEVSQREFKHAFFASIQFGALRENYHTVMHKGIGVIKLAINPQNDEKLKNLLNETPLLPIEYVEDAEKMLFDKAIMNCFINPLTAIMRMKNGQLIENEHTLQIMRNLYSELQSAFHDKIIPFEAIIDLCKKTANNTSSMLADHLAKRKSEAPYIIGAILDLAKKQKQQVPTLEVLYKLLLAKEETEEFSE